MLFYASTRAMILHHNHRILGEGTRHVEVCKTTAGVKVGIGLPKIPLAAAHRRPQGRNNVHRSGLSKDGWGRLNVVSTK